VTAYIEHRHAPGDKWGTACGASWQGWQAPAGLTLAPVVVLAPWSDPVPGDDVRTCAACVRARPERVWQPRGERT
jgi:hypothetical protein